jgi:CheY-like chemotaxis protein
MKKILIVDDEQEIRDLLKKKLQSCQYAVTVASSGNEALTISKTNLPDLILLDIVMPQMDGYQTCEKLKQNKDTKDIPVLFLTAKDLQSKGIVERYKNLGACGYIPKPSTFKDLLDKIKEIVG